MFPRSEEADLFYGGDSKINTPFTLLLTNMNATFLCINQCLYLIIRFFYNVSIYRCFIRRTRSRPEIAEEKQSTHEAAPEI